jgi:hypothetical protein
MNGLIPLQQPTKRKVFITFHHADEWYRNEFDRLFGEHFISKAVDFGDIDPDNDAEYTKRLIQEQHIVDSSVVFALYGAETYKRKHVDWEISAALNKKVGDRKGLVVMLLPTFPISPYNLQNQYEPSRIYPRLHPRTAANLKSQYADLFYWPGMHSNMPGVVQTPIPTIIETAFNKRSTHEAFIDNSNPQYQNNLP